MNPSVDWDQPFDRRVRNTYERIGTHFAQTRPEPWEEVARFLDNRVGSLGLDIGVGNGRHAQLLAEHTKRVIGIDVSKSLLESANSRASERNFTLKPCLANAVSLPLSDGTVDLSIYVATLHHLNPRNRRIESLNELARVLGTEGDAIVSAWSVTHDRFDREQGFDTTVDWILPDGESIPRFYHVYDFVEFQDDVEASELVPIETFESSGNCFAVVGGT